MVLDIGLRAKVKPELDEREADREADRLADKFRDAEQIQPDVDTDGIQGQMDGMDLPDIGGSAGGTAAAAAGGSALTGAMKGGMVQVALAGTVGLGLLSGINKVAEASPSWQKTQTLFSEAMDLFFRPFGDKMSEWFSPLAEDLLGMAVTFNDIASKDGLSTAIISLPKNVMDNLSAEGAGIGLGALAGGAGGALAGAKAGGMLGAAAGSVIPGAGTAIGGLVGAGIGAGVGGAAGILGGGAIGGKIGEAVGDFSWSDFVNVLDWLDWLNIMNWGDWVGPLSWNSFVGSLSWSNFVNVLDWLDWLNIMNWGDWVGPLSWDSFMDALSWDSFVSVIEWLDWLDVLSWSNFIGALEWLDWLNVMNWSDWLTDLEWKSWVSNLSWSNFVPKLNWGRFVPSDFGGGGGDGGGGLTPFATGGIVQQPTNALIGEAGPEAVIPLDRLGQVMQQRDDGDRQPPSTQRAQPQRTPRSSDDSSRKFDALIREMKRTRRAIENRPDPSSSNDTGGRYDPF